MVNSRVSVIIPVYNAEKYVSQCLDSIINQTLCDIEIICVNDGSKDNSLEILREYEAKDSRVMVIDKDNGGAGSARNMGLNVASGEYVNFVDADDWLDINAYEILYNRCVSENLDAVFFQLINYDDETKELYEDHAYNVSQIPASFDDQVFNHLDIKDVLFYLSVSPCNKLYKREILEGLTFPEGVMFEDNPFFFEAFLKTKRVGIIRKHFYFRRRHSNSVMTNRGKKLLDAIEISNKIVDAVKNSGYYDIYRIKVLNHKFMMVRNWYNHVNEDTKQDYFLGMKKDSSNIKSNKELFEEYEDSLTFDKKIFFHNLFVADTYKEFDLLNKLDLMDKDLNNFKNKNKKLNDGINGVIRDLDNISKEFDDFKRNFVLVNDDFDNNGYNKLNLKDYCDNLRKSNLALKAKNESLVYQNKTLKARIDELESSNNSNLMEYLKFKKIFKK